MKKRLLSVFIYTIALAGAFAPTVLYVLKNKERYYLQDVEIGGKVVFGAFALGFFLVVLATGVLKDLNKNFKTAIFFGFVHLISRFLEPIMKDFKDLSLMALYGWLWWMTVSSYGKYLWNNANIYKNERIRVRARNDEVGIV